MSSVLKARKLRSYVQSHAMIQARSVECHSPDADPVVEKLSLKSKRQHSHSIPTPQKQGDVTYLSVNFFAYKWE